MLCHGRWLGIGVGNVTGMVSARPSVLRAVRDVGAVVDGALVDGARRLSLVAGGGGVSAVLGSAVVGSSRDLGAAVRRLAESWSALEAWVGRVGDAVDRADRGGPVLVGPPAPGGRVVVVPEAAVGVVGSGPSPWDGLSDAEAAAAAVALAKQLRGAAPLVRGAERDRLRAELLPLVERLRERWPESVMRSPKSSPSMACASPPVRPPDGLEEALDLLAFGGPGRVPHTAGVAEGFSEGFLGGEAADRYDNLGGELARTAGHLTSGVMMFGDARDALIDTHRGNWAAAALAVGAMVPVLGDAAKGGEAVHDMVESATAVRRLDEVIEVRSLEELFEDGTPRASELAEWAEAQGWTFAQKNPTSPPTYIDENGVKRLTLKSGSLRTPGSEAPHVSLRDADGHFIDQFGNAVTRRSTGNHLAISWDL